MNSVFYFSCVGALSMFWNRKSLMSCLNACPVSELLSHEWTIMNSDSLAKHLSACFFQNEVHSLITVTQSHSRELLLACLSPKFLILPSTGFWCDVHMPWQPINLLAAGDVLQLICVTALHDRSQSSTTIACNLSVMVSRASNVADTYTLDRKTSLMHLNQKLQNTWHCFWGLWRPFISFSYFRCDRKSRGLTFLLFSSTGHVPQIRLVYSRDSRSSARHCNLRGVRYLDEMTCQVALSSIPTISYWKIRD